MLSIQNPRWIQYQQVKALFGSQDSHLKETVSKGIISIFWESFASDFLHCLEDIFAWKPVVNDDNVANATLEYIFDYGNISEALSCKEPVILSDDLEAYFQENFDSAKSLKEIFFWKLPNDFFIQQIDGSTRIWILFSEDLRAFQNILNHKKYIAPEQTEEKSLFSFFGVFGNKKRKHETFRKIFEEIEENIRFCLEHELDMMVFSY